jgi:hypothetical protein
LGEAMRYERTSTKRVHRTKAGLLVPRKRRVRPMSVRFPYRLRFVQASCPRSLLTVPCTTQAGIYAIPKRIERSAPGLRPIFRIRFQNRIGLPSGPEGGTADLDTWPRGSPRLVAHSTWWTDIAKGMGQVSFKLYGIGWTQAPVSSLRPVVEPTCHPSTRYPCAVG